MKPSKQLLAALHRAQDGHHLMRATREIHGADRIEGYVVAVGAKWVLLSVPDDRARPDGFKLIRLRDIEGVWRWRGSERFLRRALDLQGAWPPRPPDHPVELDSTSAMLASLSDGFEILSVFDEDDDPDVCFIGQLAVRRGSRFELAEISTRARWEGVYRSRVGRVSRVDVGGGYEAALRRVAGPRPA